MQRMYGYTVYTCIRWGKLGKSTFECDLDFKIVKCVNPNYKSIISS